MGRRRMSGRCKMNIYGASRKRHAKCAGKSRSACKKVKSCSWRKK